MPKANLNALLGAADLDPHLRAIMEQLGRLTGQVDRLRGTLAVHVGATTLHHLVADADWHELAGLDGVWLKALPELGHGPDGQLDYMGVHALQGARGPHMRNPRRQRVHIRSGTILFSRQGGNYLPYHAGESIEFDYGELHAFVVTEDCYAIAEYEPRLTPAPLSPEQVLLPPPEHFTPYSHGPTA
jgi:quercetin dioxygenase-like cupin family protein